MDEPKPPVESAPPMGAATPTPHMATSRRLWCLVLKLGHQQASPPVNGSGRRFKPGGKERSLEQSGECENLRHVSLHIGGRLILARRQELDQPVAAAT